MTNTFIQNLKNGIKNRLLSLGSSFYNNQIGLSVIKIKYLKHLPRDNKVRQIKLNIGNITYTSGQDLFHSLQELFEERIYMQSLKENCYIIDCGSNIGLSIVYFKSICPSAEIDAFEPDQFNFQLMTKNIELNNLPKVRLHNKAIWIQNTTLNFINEASLGSRIGSNEKSNITSQVQAVRLKELLIRKVDFLKIDIEGAEFEVLLDIKDQLHWVDKMFLEYHGKFEQNNQLLEILTILKSSGFNFYIKEAGVVYKHPFNIISRIRNATLFDLQLNIFCFRD